MLPLSGPGFSLFEQNIPLAIAIVVGSSVAYAGGSTLQHVAVGRLVDRDADNRAMNLRQLWRLIRTPLWLLGLFTIVIAHGKHCDLIQKQRFFATPMWEEDDKPLKLLLRSDPAIKDWPRVSRRWKGDGVLLGTEAGPDVLLYWNGRRWWVAQGTEAP